MYLLEQRPDAEVITELPYAELQCMLDDPPGFRNYWSAEYLSDCPTRRWTGSAPPLARIKATYDPDNVFHRWHNVRPAAAEG